MRLSSLRRRFGQLEAPLCADHGSMSKPGVNAPLTCRQSLHAALIAVAVITLACSGANPSSPTAVSSVVSSTISGQFLLPTTRSTLTGCPFAPSAFHTNLTCIIRESCVSVSDLQVTVTLSIAEDSGAISGTSEITGTDTIGLCSPRPTQVIPLSLTVPITGSSSNVVFGGTSSIVGLLSGQSTEFKRSIGFTGSMRDRVLAGTLTYSEDFGNQFNSVIASGSGSFQTTMRERAVPR